MIILWSLEEIYTSYPMRVLLGIHSAESIFGNSFYDSTTHPHDHQRHTSSGLWVILFLKGFSSRDEKREKDCPSDNVGIPLEKKDDHRGSWWMQMIILHTSISTFYSCLNGFRKRKMRRWHWMMSSKKFLKEKRRMCSINNRRHDYLEVSSSSHPDDSREFQILSSTQLKSSSTSKSSRSSGSLLKFFSSLIFVVSPPFLLVISFTTLPEMSECHIHSHLESDGQEKNYHVPMSPPDLLEPCFRRFPPSFHPSTSSNPNVDLRVDKKKKKIPFGLPCLLAYSHDREDLFYDRKMTPEEIISKRINPLSHLMNQHLIRTGIKEFLKLESLFLSPISVVIPFLHPILKLFLKLLSYSYWLKGVFPDYCSAWCPDVMKSCSDSWEGIDVFTHQMMFVWKTWEESLNTLRCVEKWLDEEKHQEASGRNAASGFFSFSSFSYSKRYLYGDSPLFSFSLPPSLRELPTLADVSWWWGWS